MGLFNFLKKTPAEPQTPQAIEAQEAPKTVCSPAKGTVLALSEVPDPVFSSGVMGPGCGIDPAEGIVYAPVSGTISATTATWHAIGITSDDGLEVLVHVGVDTVEMKGDGFTGFVAQDQQVKAGDPLLSFDRAKVAAAGYSDVIITVVTNGSDFESVDLVASDAVEAGQKLICVQ